jgi:S-(hydroxymethyl)glutathione dehydrogenase / alcohol dehydrogenase
VKTLAAVLERQNSPLVIRELTVPCLNEGQVLVEMAYTGLCHTQLNEIKGLRGPDPYLPHTLGHEGSGIVVDVGSGVKKTKPGDRVVLSWIKGTGADAPSTKYIDGDQWVNSGPISTFLTYAVISENRVIPIPHSMPLREAALLGCAMPTGAGVIFHEMKVRPKESIALFGLGGIGLSALLAAVEAGAYPIIAVDISETKLCMAAQCGATHQINTATSNAFQEIMKITASRGVDYSLEAVGRKEVMETAYEVIKTPGGVCILAGNLPRGQKIEIDPFDLIKGKKIFGTWGGGGNIDRDVQRYVQSFSENRLPLQRLISHEFSLQKLMSYVK